MDSNKYKVFFCTAIVYFQLHNGVQPYYLRSLIGLGCVENEGLCAFPAILTILVSGHENTGSALLAWAFPAKSVDLSVFIDLNINKTIS